MDTDDFLLSALVAVIALFAVAMTTVAYKKHTDPCQRVCSMYEIKNPVRCLQEAN